MLIPPSCPQQSFWEFNIVSIMASLSWTLSTFQNFMFFLSELLKGQKASHKYVFYLSRVLKLFYAVNNKGSKQVHNVKWYYCRPIVRKL